ncbi:hypothetical protein [Sandaracinus amylolyticus]|nr:hypothetical protein [Sandaracinus amylolyticus]UJR83390.1 Hypothetical protein I5071_54580 [Sandaracinus amylolyticus]
MSALETSLPKPVTQPRGAYAQVAVVRDGRAIRAGESDADAPRRAEHERR